jgi:hypothetical protein
MNRIKETWIKAKKNSRFYILLMLQAFSLTTTIEGAKIILSSLEPYDLFGIKIKAYLFLGIGIQLLLLWLFTIGKNEIKSPLRKWSLILIYTSFSVYTSFFSVYESLSEKNNKKNAIDSHNALRGLIYDSQVVELKDIDNKIKASQENYNQYYKIGNRKGTREETKKQTQLREQQVKLKNKYDYTENIKNIFIEKEEINNKTASEIYMANKETLSHLPAEIAEELKKKGFDKEKFSEEKNRQKYSQFLVPFVEVKQGNSEAILALILASLVDITSLIIGSIGNKETENRQLLKKIGAQIILLNNAFSKGLKELLPHLIEEIGHLISTIFRSLGSLMHGVLFGLISAKNRSLQIFYYNFSSIKIKGNRQEFLLGLWNNIDFSWDNDEVNNEEGARIIYKKLISSTQNNNESFKNGYKRLLLDMHHLKWLEKKVQNDEIFFKIIKYDDFINWYQQEESKQFEKEKHSMLSPNDYYTLISLPKKEAFYARTSKKLKFWLQQVF